MTETLFFWGGIIMCGIAGVIDWEQDLNLARSSLATMQQTLSRRGPDQNGLYIQLQAALIHARLSVVDLEHGQQPMQLKLGEDEFILAYNGELYNTVSLRLELEQLGHIFKEQSDTEVVLHAYAEWRENCVQHLNGIFAFAVWEVQAQRLFLARDRIGVKPIFYACKARQLIFGSELKTLLAHPAVGAVIDHNSIAEIMLIGPGRTPGYGVFCDIAELPPASCGLYSREGLKIWQYWRLTDREHHDSLADTIDNVQSLLVESIQSQLVADVPVGTFLSGGLDSSIIAAVAARYFADQGRQLDTFSLEYKDNAQYFQTSKFQPNSDELYIIEMSNYLNSRHHRIIIDSKDLVPALYLAVEARDLPGMADVDASLLLLCRAIKEHVTVALSGECADEIFGGYPWYRDQTIREQAGFPWAQSTAFRADFLQPEFAGLINAQEYVAERYHQTVTSCSSLAGIAPGERRMKEMTNLNFQWFMQTLLERKDRMSMYSGLEVRVPFCDHRIVEYLYAVPWKYKDCLELEKGLLRRAMQDFLPPSILWRKKSPYPKTHHPVYRQAVTEKLQALLDEATSPMFEFVRPAALTQLIESTRSVPWYGQLMTTPQTIAYFLQIDYWLRKYQIRIR